MKANFLIEFETTEEFYAFETWLKNYLHFKVMLIQDTSHLAENDNFKLLLKNKNKAQKLLSDFIFNNLAEQ